jgi:UPF0755 protein
MGDPRLVRYGATFIALVLTVVAAWFIYGSADMIDDVELGPSVRGGSPITVIVEDGQSPEDIGEALEEAGVIDSATRFKVLVAFMGYDQLLQAGEYEFREGTPALEAIYRMRRGEVSENALTVIEGWRLEEIADAAAEQGIPRDEFIAAAADPSRHALDFLADLPAGATLEGYLYPARYSVGSEETAADLVTEMLQAFGETVPAGVRESAAQVGLTFHEVVTLASIIEREAQVAEERPIMAQVFLSRLELGMTLDADPTVQYAVSEDAASVADFGYWKPGLTEDDLLTDSLYNTYVYAGLPPGPIANPRLDSITAVLNPSPTNYLYFVAKPDGSHAFAETFEEHQQNVEEFLQ